MPRSSQDLTLRIAADEDLPRLIRLAALDSARPPKPPVLLAEVGGELYVAVSLVDHKTVADPFRHTDAIRAIALLGAAQACAKSEVAPAPRERALGSRGTRHRQAGDVREHPGRRFRRARSVAV